MINQETKKHLRDSLIKGIRYDGRKKEDFRSIEIRTDVVETAEGSAWVKCGETEVIAGVKMSLEKPYADTPNEGILMVGAELLPICNPMYESGPPDIKSIEVARVIDRGIRESKSIDNKKLCVKAGELVWTVNVDLCPLNDDGNLVDVGSIAAIAAILTARFPSHENGKVDYKKKTTERIPMTAVPIAVTVVRIGDDFIIDPMETEQEALDARLTVTTIDDGKLCSIQKGGDGTLTIEDIEKMVDLAVAKGQEIRNLLKQQGIHLG